MDKLQQFKNTCPFFKADESVILGNKEHKPCDVTTIANELECSQSLRESQMSSSVFPSFQLMT